MSRIFTWAYSVFIYLTVSWACICNVHYLIRLQHLRDLTRNLPPSCGKKWLDPRTIKLGQLLLTDTHQTSCKRGGCMNWDCINAPIPFIMSLNIFVEWGFISYDKQNDLKKVNSVKIKQQVKVQLNLFPDSERKMFFLCNGLEFNLLHKLLELIVMLTYNHSIFILQCTCIKTVMTMS